MDMNDVTRLAVIEKQQENLNTLRKLDSEESNDENDTYVFGHIEGIPIGTTWPTRTDCSKSGVHRPLLDCVHYGYNGVYSLVLENINPQDAELGDWFTYTGDSNTSEEVEVNSMSRSGLALKKNSTSGLPVRIVRRVKLSTSLTQSTYRYDGLYAVRKYWGDVDVITGKKVFRCAFHRFKNQSPLPCSIDKETSLKFSHTRNIQSTTLQKKNLRKTKQNTLLDYNKLKQVKVKVDCNSIPTVKKENNYDNKVYKKVCKSYSNNYKECYVKVNMLSHQYLYDKYRISVDEFRKSKFNTHSNDKNSKMYSMSGYHSKQKYTPKEHERIKFQRKIRSISLRRHQSLTRNLVDLENSERLLNFKNSPIKYGLKIKLDDQNFPFSNRTTSALMQLNVDLYDNESKRDLLNKCSDTRTESVNSSRELQDKNNSESDTDSDDLLQLRISPPINNENVGCMTSDTEEELFAGFDSKCYFYKNKVIVEFNDKVHVCNEHNYYLSENDFSVLCEDDRHTSYLDFENCEGEVHSL